MGIKTIAVVLHMISNMVALVVSTTQTNRIIKEVRKYNLPVLVMFTIGGVLAGSGTLLLHKSLKKGQGMMRDILNNVN